jgi:hypothetical protein
MSLFGKIFGVTAAPATDAIGAIGNVFDKLFTSAEEKAQAQAVLEKIRQEPALVQAEINKLEAGHRSVFVAGWRPFIGWVCGLGFLWAFLGDPLVTWWCAVHHVSVAPPAIRVDDMMELVVALLGLGTLRTMEKLKGRSR